MKLQREGKLRRQDTDDSYLNNLLDAAKRNFEAATYLKGKIDEAAFKLVYDGLLQIGRLILLLNGFRPDDGEQHKTTFAVAGVLLGDDFARVIKKIQICRVKRNICIYDPKIEISEIEADAIFKTAQEFWILVKNYLQKKNPQLKLFDDI